MSIEKADSNTGMKIGFGVAAGIVGVFLVLHWLLLFVGLAAGYGLKTISGLLKHDKRES